MKKLVCIACMAIMICLSMFIGGCSASLASPVDLDINSSTYELSWSVVLDARSYVVEIKNTQGGEPEEISQPKTSMSLVYLNAGDYEIRVKSVGGESSNIYSDWSKTITFNRPIETGCVYTLINSNSEYEVTKAGMAEGEVVIEDYYRGKPVTSIGVAAFRQSSKITKLTLGNNIKKISERAFQQAQISQIEIPESVREIGASAFQGSYIERIELPRTITTISDYAFAYCGSLEEVVFGGNVTAIGDSAFTGCVLLESIDIPNVKTIGSSAFAGCSSLKSITFTSALTQLGSHAFYSCTALESVNFPSQDNNLTTIGSNAFADCSALTSIRLPEGIATIGYGAFINSTNLETVNIPLSVTRVGAYAFNNTKKHKTVTLKEALNQFTYFDPSMMGGKTLDELTESQIIEVVDSHKRNLTKAQFAEFEKFLFDNGLTYVDNWLVAATSFIRKYITTIGTGDFTLAVNTKGIADQVFLTSESLLEVTLPTSVKTIGEQAFAGSQLLYKLTIPNNGVTTIQQYAFADCIGLNTISLGEGLQTIGHFAFYQCETLKNSANSSIIPTTVTSIGVYAFKDTGLWKEVANEENGEGIVYAGDWLVGYTAKNLVNVAVRNGTRGISDYAFYGNITLASIYGGIEQALYIGNGAFYSCMSLTAITLNDNVRRIGDYAFYRCMSLLEITLPANVTYIGRSAFYKCESLTSIDMSDSIVEYIGMYAFYGCYNLTSVYLGADVIVIDNYAFYGCTAIENIAIPDTTKTIGYRAFYGCTSLKNVSMGAKVESLGDFAFAMCTSLLTINLPSTLKTIGTAAFYNCISATELIFNYEVRVNGQLVDDINTVNLGADDVVEVIGVETIGSYAFFGLKGLTALNLPQSVTSIGNYAFKGCIGLTSVVISNNITDMGAHAFYGCSNLTVYVEEAQAPNGWDSRWNSSFRPVIYDCTLSLDKKYVAAVNVKDGFIDNPHVSASIAAPIREGYVFLGWKLSKDSPTADYTNAAEIANAPEGMIYAAYAAEIG